MFKEPLENPEGKIIKILPSDEAQSSWDELTRGWGKKIKDSLEAKYKARLEWLMEDAGEGLKQFGVLKTACQINKSTVALELKDAGKGVRIYGWFSEKHLKTFVVSHAALKDGNKTSVANQNRIIGNWKKIEC